MGRFEDALRFSLKWEGGLADVEGDRGGLTNLGITHTTFHSWLRRHGKPLRSVATITRGEAIQIYQEMYWDEAHCGAFEWPLAVAHFDLAVNGGVGRAAKLLQRTLGLREDGVIGPKTLAAVEDHPDQLALALRYVEVRERWYRSIAKGDQKQFLKGWLNRCADLKKRLAAGPS